MLQLRETAEMKSKIINFAERIFHVASTTVAMPLTAYPFSYKFAWVTDKHGVSWQLNLERN